MPTVIDLPLPPSANGLFINTRYGRSRSQAYDLWKQEAGWLLQKQRPARVRGRVTLLLELEEPTGRKWDISNRIKAAEDLLVSHYLIDSDDWSTVRDVRAVFNPGVRGLRITITGLGEDAENPINQA